MMIWSFGPAIARVGLLTLESSAEHLGYPEVPQTFRNQNPGVVWEGTCLPGYLAQSQDLLVRHVSN